MRKILIMFLIIVLILTPAQSLASIQASSGATGDLPYRAPPTEHDNPVSIPETPPDDESDFEPEEFPNITIEPTECPTVITYYHYNVSGTVYEDRQAIYYEEDEAIGSSGTKRIGNNGKIDAGEGIAGIKVTATSGSGSYVTYTDFSGNYEFKDLNKGDYKITFEYGSIPEQSTSSQYLANYNGLKYNEQDYSAIYTDDIEENPKTVTQYLFEQKIITAGAGFTQIFLLLDFSPSMIESVSQYETRMQVVKQSAIDFINILYEKNPQNLAVGVIGFYGEAVIIKHLTNQKETLIEAIEGFSLDFATYNGRPILTLNNLVDTGKVGTNIGRAINKAKNSYINKDANNSNRIMVLFSDGTPTAHDDVPALYANEPSSSFYSKLDRVVENTRADLIDAVNNNITVLTILTELTDPEEKEYAQKTFCYDDGTPIGHYFNPQNDTIDLSEWITETIVETVVNVVHEGDPSLLGENTWGDENKAKREEINKYYDIMNYDKLKIFDVIGKMTGTSRDKEIVLVETKDTYENFINKVKQEFIPINSMTVTTERTYFLGVDKKETSTCYCTDEKKLPHVTYENHVDVNSTVNCALIKREDFALQLDKAISGVKYILADESVVHYKTGEGAKYTIEAMQRKVPLGIENIAVMPNSHEIIQIDEELIHGSTLQVEYTLIVKNVSSVPSTRFAIVDYLSSYEDMIFDKTTPLITEEGTNEKYGWEKTNREALKANGVISDEVYNSLSPDEEYLICKFDENNSSIVDPVIGANGERYVKLVLSKVFSVEDINSDLKHNNEAEIVIFSNKISRRANLTEEVTDSNSETQQIREKYSFPGNFKPGSTERDEIDSAISFNTNIIQPFGNRIKKPIVLHAIDRIVENST